MASSFWRFASKSAIPVASFLSQSSRFTLCEVEDKFLGKNEKNTTSSVGLSAENGDQKMVPPIFGMRDNEEGDYHGMFPKRQLWHPKVEYPLWGKLLQFVVLV